MRNIHSGMKTFLLKISVIDVDSISQNISIRVAQSGSHVSVMSTNSRLTVHKTVLRNRLNVNVLPLKHTW